MLDLHSPDLHLDGRGLLLQPAYFCEHAPTKLADEGERPVLVIPVAGHRLGTAVPRPDTSDTAVALLGRTRAAALAEMADGCSTSQLARRCGIAISTASHHAGVLRDAGLARTRRDGPAVVHEITDLGRRVLAGEPQQALRP